MVEAQIVSMGEPVQRPDGHVVTLAAEMVGEQVSAVRVAGPLDLTARYTAREAALLGPNLERAGAKIRQAVETTTLADWVVKRPLHDEIWTLKKANSD